MAAMTEERKVYFFTQRAIDLADYAYGSDPTKKMEYWFCRINLDGPTKEGLSNYLEATKDIDVLNLQEPELEHLTRMTVFVGNRAIANNGMDTKNGMDICGFEKRLIAYNAQFADFFNNKNGLVVEPDGSIRNGNLQPVC